jgi:V8-like Glu-specific endopeptidase
MLMQPATLRRFAAIAMLVAVIAAVACRSAEPTLSAEPPSAGQPPVSGNAQDQPRLLGQGVDETLGRYTVDELRQYLAERKTKALHERPQPALDAISDAALIDYIQRKQKTIYGVDSRKEITEVTGAQLLKNVLSIAAFVHPSSFTKNGSVYELSTAPLSRKHNLCTDQSFASQPAPAFCTGFIVGADLIATAAHCIQNGFKSDRIVFGFYQQRNGDQAVLNTRIPAADAYAPVEIIGKIFEEDGKDLAVIRVDREIAGRPALVLNLDKEIEPEEAVYVMGHPSGLPMKWAGGASVRSVSSQRGFFAANLDTFGGNSGSPVFDAVDNTVRGILVRGDTDYVTKDVCRVAFVCPADTGCRGEECTLIKEIKPFLAGLDKTVAEVMTKTFSSEELLSGSGAAFSDEYVVLSDPAPPGYKIGTYSFSLSGDRACNAWSTCAATIENGRVAFRFRLQGHNEWPFPGQAKSRGHLNVTYEAVK